MGKGDMRTLVRRDSRSRVETIPELRPWREVGWIFRDGDVLAIERRGDRTRVRSTAVHKN
jgi:hypothetical protein